MTALLKSLTDKQALALAKARFAAWWSGKDFDADAVKAANDGAHEEGLERDLFGAPVGPAPARIVALGLIWGEHRLRPGADSADGLEPARIGAPDDGVVAVLGPGHAAPVAAFASAYKGAIEVFEWRDESLAHMRAALEKLGLDARVHVNKIDLESHLWKPGCYDGVWSVDDFAYSGYPPHLAQRICKSLKNGACAVIESFVSSDAHEHATAFATSFATAFAEPHIRSRDELVQFFTDAGLAVESEEDLTDDIMEQAREGFRKLGETLASAPQLDVAVARELAWETQSWRARLGLLAKRRLERVRFVLRKDADAVIATVAAASENANDVAVLTQVVEDGHGA